jgi:hypothetical protein
MANDTDELIQELEAHINRVIGYHDPKSPYTPILNVTEKRGELSRTLVRLIDERIEQKLLAWTKQFQAQVKQNDPSRHPR